MRWRQRAAKHLKPTWKRSTWPSGFKTRPNTRSQGSESHPTPNQTLSQLQQLLKERRGTVLWRVDRSEYGVRRVAGNATRHRTGAGGDIVADRELNGPFLTIEQITRVKGIGPSIFGEIRELVIVGELP